MNGQNNMNRNEWKHQTIEIDLQDSRYWYYQTWIFKITILLKKIVP